MAQAKNMVDWARGYANVIMGGDVEELLFAWLVLTKV